MLREGNGLWRVRNVIQSVIQFMSKKDKIEYPVFCQRMSKENKNWLFQERRSFDSWNKLFNKLREFYEIINRTRHNR